MDRVSQCRLHMKACVVQRSDKSGKKLKTRGQTCKCLVSRSIQDFSQPASMFGCWKQLITHSGNITAQTITQDTCMFTFVFTIAVT